MSGKWIEVRKRDKDKILAELRRLLPETAKPSLFLCGIAFIDGERLMDRKTWPEFLQQLEACFDDKVLLDEEFEFWFIALI